MAKAKKAAKVEVPVVKAVKTKQLVDSSTNRKELAMKYFDARLARQKAISDAAKATKN